MYLPFKSVPLHSPKPGLHLLQISEEPGVASDTVQLTIDDIPTRRKYESDTDLHLPIQMNIYTSLEDTVMTVITGTYSSSETTSVWLTRTVLLLSSW